MRNAISTRFLTTLSTRLAPALLAASVIAAGCAPAGDDPDTGESPVAEAPAPATAATAKIKAVVPGCGFIAANGIGFDANNTLHAGSVIGQTISTIDVTTGAVSTLIGAPTGMADDLDFAPDGTLAYTAFLEGAVRARGADGTIRDLATGLPGINSIAFRADGRLFASQVFLGDALYEIDPAGVAPPRLVLQNIGGLNGFDFGPDGKLYGPLWFLGKVVKIDVDTGEMTDVATGFTVPAAVNFDSQGHLFAIDTAIGEVVQIDVATGQRVKTIKVPASLDNLAFDNHDVLYLSHLSDNAIYRVDTATGTYETVVSCKLTAAAGLAVAADGGQDTLYLADSFAYRKIKASNGATTILARQLADELEYPFNARVSGDHVLLGSWFTGTVQRMDRQTGESLGVMGGFVTPHDALEMSNGDLVVAELALGRLTRVSGPGGATRSVIASGLAAPAGLAMAGAGAVYVTEYAGLVSRVDLASGARTVIASGLSAPEGIDVMPDGTIVVAEVGKRRLVSIAPASGAVEEIAGNLPIGLAAPPGFPPTYLMTGVAASPKGDKVYFTSDIENAIYEVKIK